jgi:alpha-tubulin suppressor-like RCC1 family protein
LNRNGELGNGTYTDSNRPVQVGTGAEWRFVSAGRMHTVAITKDGALWAWGSNQEGQLGNATHTNSHKPVQILR